ncbi:MAG: SH3 domain-containing protein [Verrucomicrobiota bacterium]|jgi:uncharacterized protein YgiM (DUF1202 family)
MKLNSWLFGGLAWLAAASVFAQDSAREARPSAPRRGVTGALAKDLVLDPPAQATVNQDSLNVRTRPAFAGDILTHVHKGQSVTVLEQITLAKPNLNEPSNWVRIVLPTNTPVWVFAKYIDTNSMTVSNRLLNVRARPDDVHDAVARLEKGAPVKEVRRVPDWIQIEPPTNAYGWVASDFLTMEPPTAAPPATVAAVAPAAAAPVAAAPVTPEAVAPPGTNATPEATNTTPAAVAAPPIVAPEPVATAPPAAAAPAPTAPAPAAAAAAPEIPSVDVKPRLVTREGNVHRTLNVQAPADYELLDLNSGRLIEYLQPDPKDKNFQVYTGKRVSVTGPEWLDRRWPRTPILKVQTIDLMP